VLTIGRQPVESQIQKTDFDLVCPQVFIIKILGYKGHLQSIRFLLNNYEASDGVRQTWSLSLSLTKLAA
jgi:hypothetical protein